MGGTQRLPRLIGPALAKELIFTGRRISAGEAREIGLANRVVAEGEALNAARELAAEISANGPLAVRHAKAAANCTLDVDLGKRPRVRGRPVRPALLHRGRPRRHERLRREAQTGVRGKIVHETKIRVRYAEIDAQGHVNNATYLSYFEVGRVEWLRATGQSYREMERQGRGLVVVEALLQLPQTSLLRRRADPDHHPRRTRQGLPPLRLQRYSVTEKSSSRATRATPASTWPPANPSGCQKNCSRSERAVELGSWPTR